MAAEPPRGRVRRAIATHCALVVGVAGPSAGCREREREAPTCAEVSAHARALLVADAPPGEDGLAAATAEVIAARCTADAWPPEVRRCLRETPSLDAPRGCKDRLAPAARSRLDAALAWLDAATPPDCVRYERALATCAELPAAVRADLVAKLAAARQGWSTGAEPGAAGPACAEALRAVAGAAPGCVNGASP